MAKGNVMREKHMKNELRSDASSGPAHVLERVWHALENDLRIGARSRPLEVAFEAGELTLAGELEDIVTKKRAFELVQALPEVRRVVDRIAVRPAARMGDAEIRDHVRNALVGEPAFVECGLVVRAEGVEERSHDPEPARGSITASVDGGVVTLEGLVPSLAHARLAGVLAWWVPGTRDVRNELRASPPEEDSDEEITEAVRVALEKEPFVDAAQVLVHTAGGRVTLSGTLRSEEQRRLAERDAWYVSGVRDVDDRIAVHVA